MFIKILKVKFLCSTHVVIFKRESGRAGSGPTFRAVAHPQADSIVVVALVAFRSVPTGPNQIICLLARVLSVLRS